MFGFILGLVTAFVIFTLWRIINLPRRKIAAAWLGFAMAVTDLIDPEYTGKDELDDQDRD